MNDAVTLLVLMFIVGFGAECGRHFCEAISGLAQLANDRLLAQYRTDVLDAALDAACQEVSLYSDFTAKQLREQYMDTFERESGDSE